MTQFFRPEDFRQGPSDTAVTHETAAEVANRLIEERGTRVYGFDNEWNVRLMGADTHSGLLVAVEPIQKDTSAQKEIAKRIAQINKLATEIQELYGDHKN